MHNFGVWDDMRRSMQARGKHEQVFEGSSHNSEADLQTTISRLKGVRHLIVTCMAQYPQEVHSSISTNIYIYIDPLRENTIEN